MVAVGLVAVVTRARLSGFFGAPMLGGLIGSAAGAYPAIRAARMERGRSTSLGNMNRRHTSEAASASASSLKPQASDLTQRRSIPSDASPSRLGGLANYFPKFVANVLPFDFAIG